MLARQQLTGEDDRREKGEGRERRTPIYDRIRSLSDFLVFHPFGSMRHHVNCDVFFRFEEEDDTAEGAEKVWKAHDAPSLLSFRVGPLHCIHSSKLNEPVLKKPTRSAEG